MEICEFLKTNSNLLSAIIGGFFVFLLTCWRDARSRRIMIKSSLSSLNKETNSLIKIHSDIWEAIDKGLGNTLYTKVTQDYFSNYNKCVYLLTSLRKCHQTDQYRDLVIELHLRLKRLIDAILTNSDLLEKIKAHMETSLICKTCKTESCEICKNINGRLEGMNELIKKLSTSIHDLLKRYNNFHASGDFDNFFQCFFLREFNRLIKIFKKKKPS